ncbi:MAG: hypothetical protein GY779_04970, partial [Gammaproteobacteria bacterium]|nr:hypothetical protein [Gammaproteobacteria bacterium]
MNKNDVLRMLALAATLILFGMSAPVWAATQTTTTYDHDAPGEPWGGDFYDVSKMVVSWDTNDNVQVNVYTNFAGHAGGVSWKGGSINYGDLLIGTGGSGWDYAFNLDNRTNNNGGTGYLVNYSSPRDMEYYHDEFTGDRKDEIVAVRGPNRRNPAIATGNWSVVEDNMISFAFNVASLNLSDSAQLAFRWAQTCANDIAMGVGKQPGGYTPPFCSEPDWSSQHLSRAPV